MSVAIAIVAAFLGMLYVSLGILKTFAPIERIPSQMAWAHIAPSWQVRSVGVLSLLGAVGIVFPAWLGVLPWLSVAAAGGLAALQVGAILAHVRMGGVALRSLPLNAVLLLLAAFVALGYPIVWS